MAKELRILIADQQPCAYSELRSALETDRSVRFVGDVNDGHLAVDLIQRLKPGVIILDLGLPSRSEVEKLAQATHNGGRSREIHIIAAVQALDTMSVVDALHSGAHGIVPRAATTTTWINAIRTVSAGDYAFEKSVAAVLVHALRDTDAPIRNRASLRNYSLTPREAAILERITAGMSNKMVGHEFSISERTVKHHLTNIFNKLGVSNRLSLALFAINNHLTPHSEPVLLHGAPGGASSSNGEPVFHSSWK